MENVTVADATGGTQGLAAMTEVSVAAVGLATSVLNLSVFDTASVSNVAAPPEPRGPPLFSSYSSEVKDIIHRGQNLYVLRLLTDGPGFPTKREKAQYTLEAFLQARAELGYPNTITPDKYKLAYINKAWDAKKLDLKRYVLSCLVGRFGLFNPVVDGPGMPPHPPTQAEVAARVAYLLGTDLRFLCHDLDPNGHRMGFDHPFLHEMLNYFVFQSVGTHGIDSTASFGGRYGPVVVSIVTAAIKCALDHYATGVFQRIAFSAGEYAPVAAEHLALFKGMAINPYHANRLLELMSGSFRHALNTAVPHTINMPPGEVVPLVITVPSMQYLEVPQSAINFWLDADGNQLLRPDFLLPLNVDRPRDPWTLAQQQSAFMTQQQNPALTFGVGHV